MFDLDGKVACVTGSNGLLGKEFCLALEAAGAVVVGVDINKCEMPDTKSLKHYVCDLTDEMAVVDFVDNTKKKFGKIDILINSAAINPKAENLHLNESVDGDFTKYSLKNWNLSLSVNLTGMFLITREVCKVMEANNYGKIVNISSTYGICAPDQRIYLDELSQQTMFKPVDYSVSKAGVQGFTKYLASFYRETGIRVNTLSPGGTFNDNEEQFVRNYSANTILGRMAAPGDYRGAIVFLSSDASDYMTGANLVVDGGWTTL